MRPQTLDDFAGQEHLIAPGKILRRIIDSDKIPSMIFWGPPGSGKTTLAGIIARKTHADFITFSAVTGGIKEIREVMKQADINRNFRTRTILFVDEIHRFNKAQQDAFLPFVEKGSIILIGATTENPSFEINGALLSRCKVFVLKALGADDIVKLLRRGLGVLNVEADDDILRVIAEFSNGDARSALSLLEMAAINSDGGKISADIIEQCTSRKSLL
ncbi:MAG: AAA family ATPase, partial [Synergistaceae bacterium]|nr:AAA family ATPase [Synergistaceae bacterium]